MSATGSEVTLDLDDGPSPGSAIVSTVREKGPPIQAKKGDPKKCDRQESPSNSTPSFILSLISSDGVALPLGEFGGATFDTAARRAFHQFRGSFRRLIPQAWVIRDSSGMTSPLDRLDKPHHPNN